MHPNTPPTDENRNRQTNSSDQPPLSEKDFIHNGWSITSWPFWLWLFLIVVVAALIWGSKGWYEEFLQKEKNHDPFLEVTNREFSIFLWQFPSFMRVNVDTKTGYLPGFLATSENFDPGSGEEFVSAPPDLIFLYHTWHRLLAPEFIARLITPKEFEYFLEQLPEWKPANWPKAPQEYVQLVNSKSYTKTENLQTLPLSILPLIVRQAFQGWKNYFMEGPQINDLRPTFAQIKAFLEEYPHYARNYWRNIQDINGQQVAGIDYLYVFVSSTFIPDANVPKEQLTPFLKVALYNAEQAKQNR
jgi:hypothetical protein